MVKKIYESPDGGHTVYQRDFNSTKKELIYEDDWAKKQKAKLEWMRIFEMADSNPSLKKAVERIFILYRLIKK
jgi:hypothetical protein